MRPAPRLTEASARFILLVPRGTELHPAAPPACHHGCVIDWRLASTVAQGLALASPSPGWSGFKDVAAHARESERLVSAYTGLVAPSIPVAESVDRRAWVQASQASLKGVLDPFAERASEHLKKKGKPPGARAGAVMAVEVGVMSGYLSQRVLGQYEFPVLDPKAPARLLFVGPNLASIREKLDVDGEELLRWVALHETTHALQFGAVPWLREHLAAMVEELLAAATVDPKSMLKLPNLSDLRNLPALIETFKEGGLPALTIQPEQRELFERMQCFMAVLEGYAEHVMDAVGAKVLKSLPELRAALDKRRQDRTGFLRLLERVIGMEMKLRQYQQGKLFCDSAVALGGIEALNMVWSHPEALPTMRELDDAAGWIARVTPRQLEAAAPGASS